jgi:PemK-like, MazF-like toxin of type II toxin-antitoxin system
MDIPPKISIPICIEQGSIYLYCLDTKNKDGTSYKGSRFFIVLNANPKTDEVLVLTTITTKIDKQREFVKRIGEDAGTLVTITMSDFPRLTQDSVVNCNNFYQISLKGLIKKIEDGGKIFRDKLSKNVIDALTSGMLKSNQVPPDVKEKLI